MMKALILGMGISGRSAAQLLLQKGYEVHGLDKNHESIQILGITVSSDQDPINLKQFDLLVISPGISFDHPIHRAAKDKGMEIIGEIELACRFIKNPLFAITGTNGKTTVALLVAHILNQAGMPAKALGNIGIPLAADLEMIRNEIVVLELSSYQLETMTSKAIDVGVILNITPDHLDRYSSMEEYAKAKIHMKDCLKPNGRLYVFKKVMEEFGSRFNGFLPKTYGYSNDCDYFIQENAVCSKENIEWLLPICYRRGVSHDIENIMAAYLLCKEAGVSAAEFLEGLETFKKPAHRIEFVRCYKNVNYFNDSKGTNVDAVIRAVDTMQGPVVLIAGGVDKGSTYQPWLHAFKQKVKCVCVIGESSENIKKEISHALEVKKFNSLEDAVKHATEITRPGENILLSPGCSSFDMFRNYAHRGEEFKRIVNELY
jgi:UDP-N-acetylmuramoylalanine--D-glutamate ligase